MNPILYEIQKTQGATFYDENGWQVPLVFSEVNEEYATVHSAVGLLDRSRFSRLQLGGKDGIDFYHRMTTQDFKVLNRGAGKQTILTNEKGRIIDVHLVLSENDTALVLANPQTGEKSLQWFKKFIFMDDVKLKDWTHESVQFCLLGVQAESFLSDFIHQSLKEWNPFQFIRSHFEGEEIFIIKNKSMGSLGVFDMVTSISQGENLWKVLTEKGTTYGLLPIGSITYEILRVEAGIPAVGSELQEDYNPLETKMTDPISWTKGCYIGQEVIARLYNYEKISKELVGLQFGSDSARPADRIYKENQEIGKVTSAVYSIGLNQNIGLGIVRIPNNQPGNQVSVHSGSKEFKAKVRELPFLP